MKYTVTVGERTYLIDLTGDRVVVDGRQVAAELHAVPNTPLRHLVLADGAVTFVMRRTEGEGWCVGYRGEELLARVVDERAHRLRELTGEGAATAQDETIKAPMPGLVLRVEVASGDPVAAGAPLVVLEAMKMENEIRAPSGGVVRAVHVAAGQAVERGTPLVEIAANEA